MRFGITIITLVLLFCMVPSALAQERCGIEEYNRIRLLQNPQLEDKSQFENWIQQRFENLNQISTQQRTQSTYNIPVVVHVIHNGEPVGSGTNISNAQIISQIKVLNDDFQRLNADASMTPPEFVGVAGSMDIQFVLAKQDPEGLSTNGIRRVVGTKTGWALVDQNEFKALSYWPAENYLNIWVINFTDPAGYIGFAQFPVSPLPGLEGASDDRLTDGIVLKYNVVGSVDDGPFSLDPKFNKGRTASHEIGHFLGLRHIWGDVSNCSNPNGDYVADTPPQSGSTTNCPAHPQVSCSNNKMFQNYLDYTNDACMNIFTMGQISRMDVVIQNSPRRVSLLTSPGLMDPLPTLNDLGIRSIVSPSSNTCPDAIIPSIEVRNYGGNVIASSQIRLTKNGVPVETKNFIHSLNLLDTSIISFSSINGTPGTSAQYKFEILQTNGTTDGNTINNIDSITVTFPFQDILPISEPFSSIPSNWLIQNPDNQITWTIRSAPSATPANTALFIDFYNYEDEGVVDRLVSPVFDLSTSLTPVLKFDRAYARFPGVEIDQLTVLVATDCGADLNNAVQVFNKSGAALATANSTSGPFTPSGSTQWITETIPLAPFIGQSNVQLIFIAKNGYGNNLYIDNIQIINNAITDLSLLSVLEPSPVFCITNPIPVIEVQNLGTTNVTSFKVNTTINNVVQPEQLFSNQLLLPGEKKLYTLNTKTLNSGSNVLKFEVSDPNLEADDNPENDSITVKQIVNIASDRIPLREDFNSDFSDRWIFASQNLEEFWKPVTTNKGVSASYPAYTNSNIGQTSWLVSPVLDLSNALEGGLFFDVSYGKRTNGSERLTIKASKDCGITYPEILYDLIGDQFATASSSTSWLPSADTEWRRDYLNITELAGEQQVRLAFIVTNDFGNNIYIDNIEIYNDDNPFPPSIESFYAVYSSAISSSKFHITFSLPEKQNARIQLYSSIGQVVMDALFPDSLNQTYTLDLQQQNSGIYIVRVMIEQQVSSTKIFSAR